MTVLNDPFDCYGKFISISQTAETFYEVGEIDDLISRVGISSFTGRHNSLLMWSHYVQSHSGICIKFSSSIVYPFPTYSDDTSLERIISESYNIYNRFYKVRYVKSPPRVRFEDSYDSLMKALMFLFLTKYDIWRYEEEVRSVRLLEPTSNINGIKQNFYDSDIEAIYIGAVAQQSTIDAIKEILIKYYSVDIPIYKARLNPNKFGLTFSKVSF